MIKESNPDGSGAKNELLGKLLSSSESSGTPLQGSPAKAVGNTGGGAAQNAVPLQASENIAGGAARNASAKAASGKAESVVSPAAVASGGAGLNQCK